MMSIEFYCKHCIYKCLYKNYIIYVKNDDVYYEVYYEVYLAPWL